jgi:archaellum component FlaF (FlaF/FlaG flagellin family)
MVSSTYTWNDPQKRVLKLDYFNGDTTTTSYVPAVTGDAGYTTYLTWVAKGNTAVPYRPANQGYGSVADAKATKIAEVKDKVVAYVHDHHEYEVLKGQFVIGAYNDGAEVEALQRIFKLAESLITAINAGSSTDSIRSAKVDFVNLTHDSVS